MYVIRAYRKTDQSHSYLELNQLGGYHAWAPATRATKMTYVEAWLVLNSGIEKEDPLLRFEIWKED